MPPTTLPQLISSLRARAIDGAGAMYGTLLLRVPAEWLVRYQRFIPLAGWAVFARQFDKRP